MKNASEIAAQLVTIDSRSKGALMKSAAAIIMGQEHMVGELKRACDKLAAEVDRSRMALPAGHPHTDYERVSRAADILSGYCAAHTCDACPLSVVCRGTGMELPRLLDTVAEVVEKPRLIEQISSQR